MGKGKLIALASALGALYFAGRSMVADYNFQKNKRKEINLHELL